MSLVLKIRQDPRLLHQWLKRNALGFKGVNGGAKPVLTEGFGVEQPFAGLKKVHKPSGNVDWSVSLGGARSHLPRAQFPAKYSFDVNAPPDCANDFVVFTNSQNGSGTQATIIAFNNLYSTQGVAGGFCNHDGPSVKWAYNTGVMSMTSPVISLDGTKVAFVSLNPATVHVLTPGTTGSNGTSAIAPAVPGSGNNAHDARVILSGGRRDSSSSMFLDYSRDVGYVGDDGGVLHKITGVFNGVPAEVTTGGWPVAVSAAGAVLNDAVIDPDSGNVFLTDKAGNLSYVRDVDSTVGTCAAGAPPCLGFPVVAVSPGIPISDSPIVDTVTGRVFTETAANAGNAQIVQTDTALGNVIRVNVGSQDSANPMYIGDFDNNYFNGDVSTGFYYVCGKANNASVVPTLYRIGFDAAGAMNTTPDTTTLRLAHAAAQCSPITQFFNSGLGKQWLFVGVSSRCGGTGTIGPGCVMSLDTTNGIPAAATAFVIERNGTSGIIIDNVSTVDQASSIYFTDEGTGPCGDHIATGSCAVKLPQDGLTWTNRDNE